jgi:hypothetical protein
MQYKTWAIVVFLSLLAVSRISSAGRTEPPEQDAIRLESRLNQLEQRLYSLETSIRTLEQQSRLAGSTQRALNQDDVALLRAQLQTLQVRLADDECALAKVDERTLSAAMRETRIKAGIGNSDPCRLNTDTPVRLPERRN